MHSAVILVVEDDFLNRRLTKKVLLENGYQVLEAKNSEDALAILRKDWVDLAILDINLGDEEMDGIRLGQLLEDQQKVPFIYLTAYESTHVIREAIATSPYSYLTKPFKNSDLIACVELAIIKSTREDRSKPAILVKDENYTVELPLEAINYVESDGNYLRFHTDTKVYKSRSTISQLMASLPATDFVQTHRAFVVNKAKILKYGTKSVIVGNAEIPLSKKDVFLKSR